MKRSPKSSLGKVQVTEVSTWHGRNTVPQHTSRTNSLPVAKLNQRECKHCRQVIDVPGARGCKGPFAGLEMCTVQALKRRLCCSASCGPDRLEWSWQYFPLGSVSRLAQVWSAKVFGNLLGCVRSAFNTCHGSPRSENNMFVRVLLISFEASLPLGKNKEMLRVQPAAKSLQPKSDDLQPKSC